MKRTAIVFVAAAAACGGSPTPAPSAPVATPPPATASSEQAPPPPPPPPATGHPKQDLIPRSVLFGNPERANVQISPDGKRLAWVAANNGVLNVFVAPMDKLDQAKPVTSDTTRPVRQYFWTYEGKIVYLQDSGGDENWHLFRADSDGKATDLTPYKGARVDVLGVSDRKPGVIAVGINDRNPQLEDVYLIDIASGKRTLVYQNDDAFAGFTLDHDLGLVFGSKLTKTGAGETYARDGKGWKLYDTVPFEDSQTTGIAGIGPNSKTAYVLDSRGRDTAALEQLDIPSKKETVLAEDARADVGSVIMHPTKDTALAVEFDYDRPTWRALDKSIQPDLDGLQKLADGGDFSLLSTTLDFKTWIVAVGTPQHPGRVFKWDHTKHAGTYLFSSRPALDDQPLVGEDAVIIKARDGLSLVSYLSKPANTSGPVPLVLLVHGGPWARDNYGYSSIVQLLANRGYAVLEVNYRGSTGFGKTFLNAGNGQWAKKMQDDLLDAVQWAVQSGVTTKDKVAIMGGSYGGYATLVGLAMTPDVFACGVDIVGPSNLMTLIASVPPYWVPVLSEFRMRMGDWDTDAGKAQLADASPLTHAAAIARPLLIGQGANDPRVNMKESEQIVAAMKKHGLPVSYIVFPDEGHGFARPENNIAFFGAAEAFLSAHLGGYYLPLTPEEITASSMQVKDGASGIPGLPAK
jgi:dipeptidyl aminopeptidase/acylaminoacyl peptidase|nr:S9 family peptidase [Kofleriaceae bacterium]